MEFERRKGNHTHLNIAPLVDVMFLLLLFFMLTSHLIQEPAIRIKLPESKTAEARDERTRTILITKEGDIYFMDRRVAVKEIREVIRRSLGDPEKDFLRIKSDRDANVGLLVAVIDEVRLSGVKNFSIVTERR